MPKPAVVQVDFQAAQASDAADNAGLPAVEPVTVFDRRPVELLSGALETRLRDKTQFLERLV